jgi:hypothetical protein
MDHKTAAETLIKLMQKHPLTPEEKEAVEIAIGILSWTYLAKSRVKTIREKKNKVEQHTRFTSQS